MNEDNITIVLNALADKIRMLTWENECLRKRNDELTKERDEWLNTPQVKEKQD